MQYIFIFILATTWLPSWALRNCIVTCSVPTTATAADFWVPGTIGKMLPENWHPCPDPPPSLVQVEQFGPWQHNIPGEHKSAAECCTSQVLHVIGWTPTQSELTSTQLIATIKIITNPRATDFWAPGTFDDEWLCQHRFITYSQWVRWIFDSCLKVDY